MALRARDADVRRNVSRGGSGDSPAAPDQRHSGLAAVARAHAGRGDVSPVVAARAGDLRHWAIPCSPTEGGVDLECHRAGSNRATAARFRAAAPPPVVDVEPDVGGIRFLGSPPGRSPPAVPYAGRGRGNLVGPRSPGVNRAAVALLRSL